MEFTLKKKCSFQSHQVHSMFIILIDSELVTVIENTVPVEHAYVCHEFVSVLISVPLHLL